MDIAEVFYENQLRLMADPRNHPALALSEIMAENTWPRPIPVGERLPSIEPRECVLGFMPEYGVWEKGWFDDFGDGPEFIPSDNTLDSGFASKGIRVSHWLQLPPDPEGE